MMKSRNYIQWMLLAAIITLMVFPHPSALAAKRHFQPVKYSYPGEDARSHFIADIACARGTVYILDVVGDPAPEDPAKFQRVRDLILIQVNAAGERKEHFVGKVERPSALTNIAMRVFPNMDTGGAFVLANMVDGTYDVSHVGPDGTVRQIATLKESVIFDAVSSSDAGEIVAVTAGHKGSRIYRIDTASGQIRSTKIGHESALGGYSSAFLHQKSGDLFAAGIIASAPEAQLEVIVNRVSKDDKVMAMATFPGADPVKVIPGPDENSIRVFHATPDSERRVLLKVLNAADLKVQHEVQLPVRYDMINRIEVKAGPEGGFGLMMINVENKDKQEMVLMLYSRDHERIGIWNAPTSGIQFAPKLCWEDMTFYIAVSDNDMSDIRSPKWHAKMFVLPR